MIRKNIFFYCVVVLIFANTINVCYGTQAKKKVSAKNTTQATSISTIVTTAKATPPTPTPTPKITTTTLTTTRTTTRRPILDAFRLPCSCLFGQCGCCTGVILDRFNQKACLNVTYEPDDFALTASMSMNSRVIFKRTLSGKNPAPMCLRIPRLPFIRFCVRFSNIYFANRNVHLCIDMEANWEDLTLLGWSFDCVRLGASGVAVVGPEEGGGLPVSPIDSEDQTNEDYDDSARNLPINTCLRQIIFDNSIKNAVNQKPDKSFIIIEKLSNSDFKISYKNPL